MCSLINKQLLLTAYAYLFIMEQQKAQGGSEALQVESAGNQQQKKDLVLAKHGLDQEPLSGMSRIVFQDVVTVYWKERRGEFLRTTEGTELHQTRRINDRQYADYFPNQWKTNKTAIEENFPDGSEVKSGRNFINAEEAKPTRNQQFGTLSLTTAFIKWVIADLRAAPEKQAIHEEVKRALQVKAELRDKALKTIRDKFKLNSSSVNDEAKKLWDFYAEIVAWTDDVVYDWLNTHQPADRAKLQYQKRDGSGPVEGLLVKLGKSEDRHYVSKRGTQRYDDYPDRMIHDCNGARYLVHCADGGLRPLESERVIGIGPVGGQVTTLEKLSKGGEQQLNARYAFSDPLDRKRFLQDVTDLPVGLHLLQQNFPLWWWHGEDAKNISPQTNIGGKYIPMDGFDEKSLLICFDDGFKFDGDTGPSSRYRYMNTGKEDGKFVDISAVPDISNTVFPKGAASKVRLYNNNVALVKVCPFEVLQRENYFTDVVEKIKDRTKKELSIVLMDINGTIMMGDEKNERYVQDFGFRAGSGGAMFSSLFRDEKLSSDQLQILTRHTDWPIISNAYDYLAPAWHAFYNEHHSGVRIILNTFGSDFKKVLPKPVLPETVLPGQWPVEMISVSLSGRFT